MREHKKNKKMGTKRGRKKEEASLVLYVLMVCFCPAVGVVVVFSVEVVFLFVVIRAGEEKKRKR
jgi:hypothetical protein